MLVGVDIFSRRAWSRQATSTGDHSIFADRSRWRARHAPPHRGPATPRRRLLLAELRVAEQQHLVGGTRLARRKIREAPLRADLVALINPGVALDRFHQRRWLRPARPYCPCRSCRRSVRPGVRRGTAPGGAAEIVRRKEAGIHRQVGVDALQPLHHAGQRADVFAETWPVSPAPTRYDSHHWSSPVWRRGPSVIGTGLRRGSRSFLLPQVGHCGRCAT